jgi:ketosteroid isomerase-like protein
MSDLISKVKDLYAAFGRGDIATILANLTDDVAWEYEAPAEIPVAGIRRGRKGASEFFTAYATYSKDTKLDMKDFLSNENAVAAFGRYQTTILPSGIRVETPLAQYFEFRDGKVCRFAQLANTAAIVEAVRGRAASATP